MSEFRRPSIVVLAGPNGAGKSTVGPRLVRDTLGVNIFVNADTIARGLSAFAPDRAAFAAGRVMLGRIRELAGRRESFAFETTLASRSFAPWIRRLVGSGYAMHLVFLWLPSAEFAVRRVADRVRLGGHHVPADTVRRRYRAGQRNFARLYRPMASTWRLYDNSNGNPCLVVEGERADRIEIHEATKWRLVERGFSGEA